VRGREHDEGLVRTGDEDAELDQRRAADVQRTANAVDGVGDIRLHFYAEYPSQQEVRKPLDLIGVEPAHAAGGLLVWLTRRPVGRLPIGGGPERGAKVSQCRVAEKDSKGDRRVPVLEPLHDPQRRKRIAAEMEEVVVGTNRVPAKRLLPSEPHERGICLRHCPNQAPQVDRRRAGLSG
jgi:hypothetical protein